MLGADTVQGAIREAADAGWACVRHALAPEDIAALLREAQAVTFEPMEPLVGRVRQGGTVARVSPSDTRLPQLGSLSQAVTQGIRISGVAGAAHFSANEAMYQRYHRADDGVSVHRDQSFYRVAVVVFTLQGGAAFALFDPERQAPMKEWVTEPGEMCLLAGGGLTEHDRRPRHRVGPPVGSTRVSLSIRMKVQ